jgi:hypothetical protein
MLKAGAVAWNDWRTHSTGPIDLAGAILRDLDLRGGSINDKPYLFDLKGADLFDADLSGATLMSVDFEKVNLVRANLTGARIYGSSFSGADMTGCSLSDALCVNVDLSKADLQHADLHHTVFREPPSQGDRWRFAPIFEGTNFSYASLGGGLFSNCDLSKAKGLDSCHHHGPTAIDWLTLVDSHLPVSFLRGCGLPDRLIDYLPSLSDNPIQFYSCFISYSATDYEFADRLHADLQNHGVRCWFAPHDMQGGKKIHEQIDDAVRISDRLLLILSPSSMMSRWVKTEIASARQKEAQCRRRVLFPIALVSFDAIRQWVQFDADMGDDAAKEIREYHIPDFSAWTDHASYRRAFDRLLSDLRSPVET